MKIMVFGASRLFIRIDATLNFSNVILNSQNKTCPMFHDPMSHVPCPKGHRYRNYNEVQTVIKQGALA